MGMVTIWSAPSHEGWTQDGFLRKTAVTKWSLQKLLLSIFFLFIDKGALYIDQADLELMILLF
jgi:hypothetical protein